MKHFTIALFILFSSAASGQGQTKRVLFIGNSYTGVNNLPQLVNDVAASTGDSIYFDSNTPGGQNFYGHTFDAGTVSRINAGNWDFVVLQEQSQAPSLPTAQVVTGVFPYAHLLDSMIHAHSPCGETVFYMTWGRKNGDALNCANYPAWPYVCTYEGMDSLLNLRYRMMADSNDALLSPVGAVWHYLRQNNPLIELYQTDESHPSVAGSYAAACCFYTTLLRKDPALISFNAGLSATDAAAIRNAAKRIVYDSLMNWHIGEYDPVAGFTYNLSGSNQLALLNTSFNANSFLWRFGDGDTSAAVSPVHTYSSPGLYDITLVSEKCGKLDSSMQTISVTATGFPSVAFPNEHWMVYPTPASASLILQVGTSGPKNYRILNAAGTVVLQSAINSSTHIIHLTSLPGGLYFIQLLRETRSVGWRKFIKIQD